MACESLHSPTSLRPVLHRLAWVHIAASDIYHLRPMKAPKTDHHVRHLLESAARLRCLTAAAQAVVAPPRWSAGRPPCVDSGPISRRVPAFPPTGDLASLSQRHLSSNTRTACQRSGWPDTTSSVCYVCGWCPIAANILLQQAILVI